jgi:thiamine biosynthesis lipoprotein
MRFEFSHPGLGTTFRVVVYCSDDHAAGRAEGVVVRTVAQLVEVFDENQESSDLYQVHANAGIGAVRVSSDMFGLLRQTSKIAARTGGALDVAGGASSQLWAKAVETGKMPADADLDDADAAVGADKLRLDAIARTVQLMNQNARLDLHDIAVGFACDAIVANLAKAGMPSALVQAGRQVAVGATPPGRPGWKIELDDTVEKQSPRFVTISDRAIVSSGSLKDAIARVDGKLFSRTVDPRTGLGATNLAPVTVAARRCWQATCLARAAAVMGDTEGTDFVKKTPGATCWFHHAPGEKVAATQPSKM